MHQECVDCRARAFQFITYEYCYIYIDQSAKQYRCNITARQQRQYTYTTWWSKVRTQVDMVIYRSYRYKFHGHLIPSLSSELWPSGYDGRLVIWRPCRAGGSNPTVVKIFFLICICSVFLAAGLAAFKWSKTWHPSEVKGAKRERKIIFKMAAK